MSTPKPFYKDLQTVKAIVLGCDPTAFDKDHKRLEFEFVFDLGNDERYFAGVLANLEQVDLSVDDIYVQNLVSEYQDDETSKNEQWQQTARACISERKKEFDRLDPERRMPVFLTSEELYKVLLNPEDEKLKAVQLYNFPELLPIPGESNLLGRPLIPLYRHWNYNLKKWTHYNEQVKRLFDSKFFDDIPDEKYPSIKSN